MNVLLLGATGLLGHNVLIELLDRGHRVVALVRDAARLALPARFAKHPMLSLRQGSLLDDEELQRAATGCDAIVNCAGTTDMSLLHYSDYLPVNRDLPVRLVATMERNDISTLVHVSTANTIGYGSPQQLADETAQPEPPFSESFYTQSKLEGECALLAAAVNHPQWHLVILNPGFMVGAYDTHPSSGKLLLAAYRRRWMAAPKGGKSFVAVGDVAVATANALTMGRSAERYLLTGANLSLGEFYALQAEVCGYRQRLFALPDALVRLAGRIGDMLRALHIATQLSTRNVRQLIVREYYTSEKARRELQFPQTSTADAIEAFFRWYRNEKP